MYYYPFYCYRQFPSTIAALESITDDLSHNGYVCVYKKLVDAQEAGRKMLCDDDDYGIIVLKHFGFGIYEYFLCDSPTEYHRTINLGDKLLIK